MSLPWPYGPVEAVVFDWGGTLTPFHDVDPVALWHEAAVVLVDDPAQAPALAAALHAAERASWDEAVLTGRSFATADVLRAAAGAVGVRVRAERAEPALAVHRAAWVPHTRTDPQAAPLLDRLRARGVKTGLLSNTHWPAHWHEEWLARDGMLGHLDARVYSSEIGYVKPHPGAFAEVLARLGVADPARAVFVGDRPHDDVHGARSAGLRAVRLAHPWATAYDGHPPDAVLDALADLEPLLAAWERAGG